MIFLKKYRFDKTMACSDSICMRVYWYVHCLFKQISIDRRIFLDIGMLYFQLKVNYNINKYLICQLIKLRIESIVSSLNQLKNHSHSIYIGNQFNAPMILNRIFLFGGRQKSSFRFFYISRETCVNKNNLSIRTLSCSCKIYMIKIALGTKLHIF